MGLSTIQWCDYTFNPWIGCRKVAEECRFCYAETLDRNRYSKTLAPGTKANPVSHWGSGPRHRTKTWGDPAKWNRQALGAFEAMEHYMFAGGGIGATAPPEPRRPRVFCASLADWLDDENVPIEWFSDLLKLIHGTPNIDWLLLTKRPQNWLPRCLATFDHMGDAKGWLESWLCVHGTGSMAGDVPANVWIGVSAGADQSAALEIPALIHFLSCEPMLRPLDTTHAGRFDWIIFGGESGSKARACNIDWVRDGVNFCAENRIAPFVKQFGSNPKYTAAGMEFRSADGLDNGRAHWTDPSWMIDWNSPHNSAPKIKDSHGGDMDEWPEDLRVREFPKEGAK